MIFFKAFLASYFKDKAGLYLSIFAAVLSQKLKKFTKKTKNLFDDELSDVFDSIVGAYFKKKFKNIDHSKIKEVERYINDKGGILNGVNITYRSSDGSVDLLLDDNLKSVFNL